MILQKINDNTQVIYTREARSDYRNIAKDLKLTKKDGNIYKYVDVRLSEQYYAENGDSMSSVKLSAKENNVFIIDDSYDFTVNTTPYEFIKQLNHFGNKIDLNIAGIKLTGPFITRGDAIVDNNGVTVSFANKVDNTVSNDVHKLIHRLSTDNGNLLAPIIARYNNAIQLFKGNKHLLTGYAKLESYLTLIKYPGKLNLEASNNDSDSDYSITLTGNQSRLKVVNYTNGILSVELILGGEISSENNESKRITPYILMTTKPITLKNQKMPFTVVKRPGNVIFVTALLFDSGKVLKEMKGGINLLL